MDDLQGGTLTLEHRYRIESRASRHAFITRYRGVQLPFENPIWIKVYELLDEGPEADLFDRIESSAQRAHQLHGPGILRTLDYGELERHVPFVISERVHDTTLRDRIESDGPMEETNAVRLIDRLAEALESAHEQGICHGTLAPQWITLGASVESAHIDHFAVGLTLSEMRRLDGAVLTSDAVGSVPPEAFAREESSEERSESTSLDDVTEAADVYALGTVAYYACAGHHPFFGDEDTSDASEGIVRVQQSDPRPLAQFGFDEAISEIVQRALHRDPDRRWESPEAFATQLTRAADLETSVSFSGRQPETPPRGNETPEPESFESTSPTEHTSSERSPTRPPGPASTLVTLAIALLVITNLAWFFDFMAGPSRSAATPNQSSSPPPSRTTLDSNPPGLSMYTRADGQPIGETPITMSTEEWSQTGPIYLEAKKGRAMKARVSLEPGPSGPRIMVHLPDTSSENHAPDASP